VRASDEARVGNRSHGHVPESLKIVKRGRTRLALAPGTLQFACQLDGNVRTRGKQGRDVRETGRRMFTTFAFLNIESNCFACITRPGPTSQVGTQFANTGPHALPLPSHAIARRSFRLVAVALG